MRKALDCWVCEFCGHPWIAKNEIPPDQCSSCHRRGWHTATETAGVIVPAPDPIAEPQLQQRVESLASGVIGPGGKTCPSCLGHAFSRPSVGDHWCPACQRSV